MKYLERILFRRPRLLNLLHSFGIVNATSQTNEIELQMIEKYAADKKLALEVGSYQGVSAARIAKAMAADGTLYCVDPWEAINGNINPCYAIFQRHLRRAGVTEKILVLQNISTQADELLPDELDFIFIDGDHSWTGVETDWRLVGQKLRVGGVVCLHDSFIPREEPWRSPDSVRFYDEIIRPDKQFEMIDSVHSLAVMRRIDL